MNYKLDVLSRSIAAIFGGYAISVAFSFFGVAVLGWVKACDQNEAIMIATMLSYIVYFSVIILSFSRQSSRLLWQDIILILSFFTATYWLLGGI